MLTSAKLELISNYYGTTLTKVSVYKPSKKGRTLSQYTRVKQLYCAPSYGQILFFVIFDNKAAAIIKNLRTFPVPSTFWPSDVHVLVEVTSEINIIDVKSIHHKCIFIQISITELIICFKIPLCLNAD